MADVAVELPANTILQVPDFFACSGLALVLGEMPIAQMSALPPSDVGCTAVE